MLAKRTLVSVCRAWYLVGTSFLYRTITLANRRQIDAIWRTLGACPRLGELDMARIFELCLPLTRVNDLPPEEYPLLSTVTALNLGQHRLPRSYIHDTVAQSCSRLEELSIYIDGYKRSNTLALSFPCLHMLRITCGGRSQSALAHWKMPQLKHLTFRASRKVSRTGIFEEYQRILKLHRAKLKSLVLPPYYPGHHDRDPVLEHLVIQKKFYRYHTTCVVPPVKWLDRWHHEEEDGDPFISMDAMRVQVPKLADWGVRVCGSELAALLSDIPRVPLPPRTCTGTVASPSP
ncbi:hypothetical protein B0H17DRAFT_1209087 [Mycena rosella]|uniref:F-box domain-containing protein n=1 Tax=Mycena rosella TaxID=1033263 RepID=A0AAD7CZE0_MYCRO|nr:hypothetical protein B0H17DRAFT_1209087 [Mycena rosella]